MDKYQQILDSCEERMTSSFKNFTDNLKKIRTGRANPAMLDGINVDYYGTMTPLNQCCSITVEDSKTLSLSPWDKGLVQEIDRAIQKSDIGINPTVAGDVIRIIMPPLTEESRIDLTKKAKAEAENGRIAIRNIPSAWNIKYLVAISYTSRLWALSLSFKAWEPKAPNKIAKAASKEAITI